MVVMDIQPHCKLFDVLNAYPALEEHIMGLAPPFKNLRNPVLRKTVGKLATLERIAAVGKIDVYEFVNSLRQTVGQDPITQERASVAPDRTADSPAWVSGEPAHTINGNAMLERGEHPLQLVNQLMQELPDGRHLLLETAFAPLPLIDAMEKQRYQVFHVEVRDGQLHMYPADDDFHRRV